MKTYQSVLLDAINSGETKPEMERRLKSEMCGRLERALRGGYWFCHSCDAMCEREEGEHGEPAHCQRCGSARLEYVPPLFIEDRQFLAPEDLK